MRSDWLKSEEMDNLYSSPTDDKKKKEDAGPPPPLAPLKNGSYLFEAYLMKLRTLNRLLQKHWKKRCMNRMPLNPKTSPRYRHSIIDFNRLMCAQKMTKLVYL